MIKFNNIFPGDYVMSRSTTEVFKIIQVNREYGWFSVKLRNGKLREFRINNENDSFNKLTKEEVADHFLMLANCNQSDAWRDYDER